DDEARLEHDLIEALVDPVFELDGVDPTQLRRFVLQTPDLARSLVALYRAFRTTRESAESLAARLEGPSEGSGVDPVRLSSELVSDFVERRRNHFPAIEEAAERVRNDARLDEDDLFTGLTRFLKKEERVTVKIEKVGAMHGALRRFDPERRELR